MFGPLQQAGEVLFPNICRRMRTVAAVSELIGITIALPPATRLISRSSITSMYYGCSSPHSHVCMPPIEVPITSRK